MLRITHRMTMKMENGPKGIKQVNLDGRKYVTLNVLSSIKVYRVSYSGKRSFEASACKQLRMDFSFTGTQVNHRSQ